MDTDIFATFLLKSQFVTPNYELDYEECSVKYDADLLHVNISGLLCQQCDKSEGLDFMPLLKS